MSLKVKAIYRDGSFVPQAPCDLVDGAQVDLLIEALEPQVEPGSRARRLKALAERMQRNPIPAEASRWTRDELHERR